MSLSTCTGTGTACSTSGSSMSNSVTFDGTYWVITSTGCPNYDYTSETTPCSAKTQSYSWKLPRYPQISTTKIYVGIYGANGVTLSTRIMGNIGMAINGVTLYGNSDANGRDAWIYESSTFDTTGGHTDPSNSYHYHEEVANTAILANSSGTSHSPLFGIMMDGIPIYGQYGDSGIAPTNLDECNGHVDSTYSFYHYHLPKNGAFPYLPACLTGCIYNNNGNANFNSAVTTNSTCVKNATQYSYAGFNWQMMTTAVTAPTSAYAKYVATSTSSTTATASASGTKVSTSDAHLPTFDISNGLFNAMYVMACAFLFI